MVIDLVGPSQESTLLCIDFVYRIAQIYIYLALRTIGCFTQTGLSGVAGSFVRVL
jgi:hypothetical protein